jgi:hypothetical protein
MNVDFRHGSRHAIQTELNPQTIKSAIALPSNAGGGRVEFAVRQKNMGGFERESLPSDKAVLERAERLVSQLASFISS